jgi:hypothetical protein
MMALALALALTRQGGTFAIRPLNRWYASCDVVGCTVVGGQLEGIGSKAQPGSSGCNNPIRSVVDAGDRQIGGLAADPFLIQL